MKLEKSTDWNPPKIAWRVECRRMVCGPWCYSLRDAIWQWLKNNWAGRWERWQ